MHEHLQLPNTGKGKFANEKFSCSSQSISILSVFSPINHPWRKFLIVLTAIKLIKLMKPKVMSFELSKNPLSHSTLLRFSPLGGTASDEEWRVDSNFDLLPSFRTTDSEAPLLAEVKISKTIKIEMILAIRPYFYC